jgi:hypothetical protein
MVPASKEKTIAERRAEDQATKNKLIAQELTPEHLRSVAESSRSMDKYFMLSFEYASCLDAKRRSSRISRDSKSIKKRMKEKFYEKMDQANLARWKGNKRMFLDLLVKKKILVRKDAANLIQLTRQIQRVVQAYLKSILENRPQHILEAAESESMDDNNSSVSVLDEIMSRYLSPWYFHNLNGNAAPVSYKYLEEEMFIIDPNYRCSSADSMKTGMRWVEELAKHVEKIKNFHQKLENRTQSYYPAARTLSESINRQGMPAKVGSGYMFWTLRKTFEFLSPSDSQHLKSLVDSIRKEEMKKISEKNPSLGKAELDDQASAEVKRRVGEIAAAVKAKRDNLKGGMYLNIFLIIVEMFLLFQVDDPAFVPVLLPTRQKIQADLATDLLQALTERKLTEEEIQKMTDYVASVQSVRNIGERKSLLKDFINLTKRQGEMSTLEASNMLREDRFGNCLLSTCLGLMGPDDCDGKKAYINQIISAAKKDPDFTLSEYWKIRLVPSLSSAIEQVHLKFDCLYGCHACEEFHGARDATKSKSCKSSMILQSRIPKSKIESIIETSTCPSVRQILWFGDNFSTKSSPHERVDRIFQPFPRSCYPLDEKDQPEYYRSLLKYLGDPGSDPDSSKKWVATYSFIFQQCIDYENDIWSDILLPVIVKLMDTPEFTQPLINLDPILNPQVKHDLKISRTKSKDYYFREKEKVKAFKSLLREFFGSILKSTKRKLKSSKNFIKRKFKEKLKGDNTDDETAQRNSIMDNLWKKWLLSKSRMTHGKRLQTLLFAQMLRTIVGQSQTQILQSKLRSLKKHLNCDADIQKTTFAKELRSLLEQNFDQWQRLQLVLNKITTVGDSSSGFGWLSATFEKIKLRLLYPQLALSLQIGVEWTRVQSTLTTVGFKQHIRPRFSVALVNKILLASLDDISEAQDGRDEKLEATIRLRLLHSVLPDCMMAGRHLLWTTIFDPTSISGKSSDDDDEEEEEPVVEAVPHMPLDFRPGMLMNSLWLVKSINYQQLARATLGISGHGLTLQALRLLQLGHLIWIQSPGDCETYLDRLFAKIFDPLPGQYQSDAQLDALTVWQGRSDLWGLRRDRYLAFIEATAKIFAQKTRFGDFSVLVLECLVRRTQLIEVVKLMLTFMANQETCSPAFGGHLLDCLQVVLEQETSSPTTRPMIINHFILNAFADPKTHRLDPTRITEMAHHANKLIKAIVDLRQAPGTPISAAQLSLIRSLVLDNHFKQIIETPAFTDDQKLKDYLLPLHSSSGNPGKHPLLKPAEFQQDNSKLVAEQIYAMKFLPQITAFDLRYLARRARITGKEKGRDLYFALRMLGDPEFIQAVSQDHDSIPDLPDLAVILQASLLSGSMRRIKAVLDLLEHHPEFNLLQLLDESSVLGDANDKVKDSLTDFAGPLCRTMALASIARDGVRNFFSTGYLSVMQQICHPGESKQFSPMILIEHFDAGNLDCIREIIPASFEINEISSLDNYKRDKNLNFGRFPSTWNIDYLFACGPLCTLNQVGQDTESRETLARLFNLFTKAIESKSNDSKVQLIDSLLVPDLHKQKVNLLKVVLCRTLDQRLTSSRPILLTEGWSILDPQREVEANISNTIKSLFTVPSIIERRKARSWVRPDISCAAQVFSITDGDFQRYTISNLAYRGSFSQTAGSLVALKCRPESLIEVLKQQVDLVVEDSDFHKFTENIKLRDDVGGQISYDDFCKICEARVAQIFGLVLGLACYLEDKKSTEAFIAWIKPWEKGAALSMACRMFLLNMRTQADVAPHSRPAQSGLLPARPDVVVESWKAVASFVQETLADQQAILREGIYQPYQDPSRTQTTLSYLELLDLAATHSKELAANPQIISDKLFANSKNSKGKKPIAPDTLFSFSHKLVKSLASEGQGRFVAQQLGRSVALYYQLVQMAEKQSPFMERLTEDRFPQFSEKKQIFFVCHDEVIEFEVNHAAVLIKLEPANARSAWPDEDELQASRLTATLRLRMVGDQYKTFDPKTRCDPYRLQAFILEEEIQKITRKTISHLDTQPDSDHFTTHLSRPEGPFSDNSSSNPTIPLDGSSYRFFSSTFGEGFNADRRTNEAFVRQLKAAHCIAETASKASHELPAKLDGVLGTKVSQSVKGTKAASVWTTAAMDGLNLGF